LGALGLASLQVAQTVAIHLNLGPLRDREASSTATLVNAALAWTPNSSAVLFLEAQANDRRASLGGVVRTVGGRWWLIKDKFGIDVTSSRTAGNANTTLGGGFGWYGF
jgi:hypothetical protein